MRAVLQRVTEASVTIDGQKVGEIGKGIMVLFGMLGTDTDKTIDYMLDKVINLRIFEDENGNLPASIDASALNSWLFNKDTIRQVLNVVMQNALKIDYGSKIGKTIIFAKSHDHAEEILKVFNQEYPHLNGYAMVIDNRLNYAQSAIDEFSNPKKLPQIAISVDMLDTGIDVPEVLNLVFFKKVLSKAKFWQMIGRGTRLCPGLLDGEDKKF